MSDPMPGGGRGAINGARMLRAPVQASARRGPDPSWWEAFNASVMSTDEVRVLRREQAVAQRLDAVEQSLKAMDISVDDDAPWYLSGSRIAADRRRAALWQGVITARQRNPKAFAGLPGSLDELIADAEREGDRRSAEVADIASRGRRGAGIAGALAAGMSDPLNVATLPIGIGGARSIADAALREGILNLRVETAQLASRGVEKGVLLGETMTVGDAATDLAVAFGGGFVFGGAGKALEVGVDRLGAFRRAERAGADDLADAAEDAIGADNLSSDDAAALRVVRREAEIDEASPYAADGEGNGAHRGRLAAAMERVLGLARRRTPLPPEPAVPVRVPVAGDAREALKARIRRVESGGNDAARNPQSSATGRYQFIDSTWLRYHRDVIGGSMSDAERLAQRRDGAVQDRLMDALTDDNAAALQRFKLPATAGNLYLAHFAGSGGAVRLLRASPDRPVSSILSAGTIRANRSVLEGKTAGQVVAWTDMKMGGAGTVPAAADAASEAVEAVASAPIAANTVPAIGEGLAELSAPARSDVMPSHALTQVQASGITIDADLMQFKAGGDAFGVTERLRGVTEWNPLFAGRVMLWQRASDGALLAADGHQRVGLAKRIGAAEGRDIPLDAIVLREADGVSAGQARTLAALKNISEGTGSAIDAAKVMREAGREAVLAQLPPRSALVRDADALARLSDPAFGAVVNEVIPADHAAQIGRLLPDDPDLHEAIVAVLAKAEPANQAQAASIVRQAIAAGFTRETQTDMFGAIDTMASLFADRAKVLDRAVAKLRTMRNAFRVAAREADTLEAGGNRIDAARSEQEALDNATAIELVERLAHSAGPVKDAIDRAARELAGGGKLGPVVDGLTRDLRGIDLRAAIRDSGLDGGDGDAIAGAGSRVSEADEAQAGLFGDPGGPVAAAQADSLAHDLRAEMTDPSIADRQRQEAQLRADSPMRSAVDPDSTIGAPLFDAADQPGLDLGTDVRGLLDDLDAEAAAIKTVRDCL